MGEGVACNTPVINLKIKIFSLTLQSGGVYYKKHVYNVYTPPKKRLINQKKY